MIDSIPPHFPGNVVRCNKVEILFYGITVDENVWASHAVDDGGLLECAGDVAFQGGKVVPY